MEIKKTNPKLLYLDQKDWVKLLRVHKKQDLDQELFSILTKIQKLIDKCKLKVVISLANSTETKQYKNRSGREDMANFMISISNGYTFMPYVFLIETEILNYFKRLNSIEEYNIREKTVGIGLPYLIGTPMIKSEEIEEDILNELNKRVIEEYSTIETLKSYLSKYSPADKTQIAIYKSEAEIPRQIIIKLRDKYSKDSVILNNYFKYYLFPWIGRVADTSGLSDKRLIPSSIFQDYKELRHFIQEFPLMYTEFCLVTARDRDKSRKIEANDLHDIASFAFTIQYFDIVVGEKYFITKAKKEKLDKLFKTHLLTDLHTLGPILDRIR